MIIEHQREQLVQSFVGSMPLPAGMDHYLRDSLLHVLHAPGSLARPRIILQMSAVFGQAVHDAEDLAMGLEYFHTASLLIDDLPCMDNATQRRGVPCVHIGFGESGAIVAALALINRGYALVWKAVSGSPRERQSDALAYIERRLGVDGLLNGQSLDLHYATLPHDRQTSERIALGKTVSLIRLSLVLPAILGGASHTEVLLLERVALFWGLSYQILDDFKDVLECPATTGKTTARDAALDRPNVVLILGVTTALHRIRRLIRIGDLALARVVSSRPALQFLWGLQSDLEERVAGISETTAAEALQVLT